MQVNIPYMDLPYMDAMGLLGDEWWVSYGNSPPKMPWKHLLKQPFQREFHPPTGGEFSTGIPTKNALVGAVGPSGWRIKLSIPEHVNRE